MERSVTGTYTGIKFDQKIRPEIEPKMGASINNLWTHGKLGVEAIGDRVLVLEDDFASGYECSECKGTCKVSCGKCDGRGFTIGGGSESECFHCGGTGKDTCLNCNGKGVKSGGIVVPDEAQRRPSTGRVVSCGSAVKEYFIGEHVIYTNYAGTLVNIKQGQSAVLRFMREHEIMGKLYGVTGADVGEILAQGSV